MTNKTQKILSAALVAFVAVLGFEVLVYILNLNQPAIYLQVAFWIYVYMLFKIVFLFDLHFKERGNWHKARLRHESVSSHFHRTVKTITTAFVSRFRHFGNWRSVSQWLHSLLLPSFIFWSTVSLFYVNFGYTTIQQTIAVLSSIALVLNYWYIKEFFYRRKEVVDSDIFVVLGVVKIYTAGALFAASMSMLRYYCLPSSYFAAEVFGFSFLLVYLALYQHRLVNYYTVAITAIIALMMGLIGRLVYIDWGYNYFTAAVFLTVCYNLFWGIFHYRLDGALSRRAFAEILLISLLVMAMVLSVTNFRAKILDGCSYTQNTDSTDAQIT